MQSQSPSFFHVYRQAEKLLSILKTMDHATTGYFEISNQLTTLLNTLQHKKDFLTHKYLFHRLEGDFNLHKGLIISKNYLSQAIRHYLTAEQNATTDEQKQEIMRRLSEARQLINIQPETQPSETASLAAQPVSTKTIPLKAGHG